MQIGLEVIKKSSYLILLFVEKKESKVELEWPFAISCTEVCLFK